MTRMVMAICGERYESDKDRGGSGWHVHRYAYLDELQDGARMSDEKYALALVNRLGAAFEGDTSSAWIVGTEPPKSFQRFFDIYLEVSNHGKANARYHIDYSRYPGCPSQAVDDGMEIYRAIKKFGVRPATEIVANNKKRAIESDEAEKRREKFEVGKKYWTEVDDSLGHVIREEMTFKEKHKKHVRRYEGSGDEYMNFKGKIFKAENTVE